jgi:hypothetical protein
MLRGDTAAEFVQINPELGIFQGRPKRSEMVQNRANMGKMGPRFPIDPSPWPSKGLLMPTKKQLLDLQFIEMRHKLIEVGAFLDRIERHKGEADYRLKAMEEALPLLQQSGASRAKAILEALSDHSTGMAETADFQGAFGAPKPEKS